MCFHPQIKVWGGTYRFVRHKVLNTLPPHRDQYLNFHIYIGIDQFYETLCSLWNTKP